MSEELIREVLRRQETFSEQMDGVLRRQDAPSEEYTRLVEFLGEKFDGIDRRFEAVDRRFETVDRRFDAMDRHFVKIEVQLEGARDERKILAEGIQGTNERLDRFLVRLERLEAG